MAVDAALNQTRTVDQAQAQAVDQAAGSAQAGDSARDSVVNRAEGSAVNRAGTMDQAVGAARGRAVDQAVDVDVAEGRAGRRAGDGDGVVGQAGDWAGSGGRAVGSARDLAMGGGVDRPVVAVPNPDLRRLLAARGREHRFVTAEHRARARLAVVERSGWLVVGDAALADAHQPVPTGALPHHAAVAAGLLRQLAGARPGDWYALDLDGQRMRGGNGAPDLG